MKHVKTINVSLIFLIGLLVLMATGCPKDSEPRFTGGLPTVKAGITAKGVEVLKHKEAVVPASFLPVIDAGLQKSLDRAADAGYKNMPAHAQFTVGFWPRSSKCINPGFLIAADGSPWDGTEFDKDPKPYKVSLCIAGIARQYANGWGGSAEGDFGMLVVADAGILETIIWFEAEHEILYAADPDKYVATMGVHAHPIIGPASLTSDDRFKATSINLPEALKVGEAVVKPGNYCLLMTK